MKDQLVNKEESREKYIKEKKIKTRYSVKGRTFSVNLDDVQLPSGRITERIKVFHPDAVAIIPFIDDNTVILVRQWRYSIERETLEIPAGKLNKGESLEECLQRELMEETGYKAGKIEHLLSYAPAIGYSDEILHIFAGYDLENIAGTEINSDEITRIEKISIDDLQDRIHRNEVYDGKTIIALAVVQGKIAKNSFTLRGKSNDI
ncbi:MAG: NUDIX hydrolase [Candidatus Hodarchaeales archaeon]